MVALRFSPTVWHRQAVTSSSTEAGRPVSENNVSDIDK